MKSPGLVVQRAGSRIVFRVSPTVVWTAMLSIVLAGCAAPTVKCRYQLNGFVQNCPELSIRDSRFVRDRADALCVASSDQPVALIATTNGTESDAWMLVRAKRASIVAGDLEEGISLPGSTQWWVTGGATDAAGAYALTLNCRVDVPRGRGASVWGDAEPVSGSKGPGTIRMWFLLASPDWDQEDQLEPIGDIAFENGDDVELLPLSFRRGTAPPVEEDDDDRPRPEPSTTLTPEGPIVDR